MVAAAIFLDGHITLWALLCVGRNPVRCLRVVVALFDPFLQVFAEHRIMPVLAAFETEDVPALADDGSRLHVDHFDGVGAVGRWAPAQQTITLKNAKMNGVIRADYFGSSKRDVCVRRLTSTKLFVIKC